MNTNLKFLSVKDVAASMGCSLPTARKIMLRNDFPLVKVGRAFKVSESAFLEWISHRRV